MTEVSEEQKALALRLQSQTFEVTDDQSFVAAGAIIQRAVDFIAERKEYWKDPKAKAHAAHKAICDKELAEIGPALEVKRILDPRLGAFHQKQLDEQRVREAAALAEAQKTSDDAVLAEAEALEAGGQPEAAMAVIATPAPTPVVAVNVVATPKLSGTHFRDEYTLTVTANDALLAFLFKSESLRHLVLVDMAGLKRYIDATEGRIKMPGLSVTVGKKPVTRKGKQ